MLYGVWRDVIDSVIFKLKILELCILLFETEWISTAINRETAKREKIKISSYFATQRSRGLEGFKSELSRKLWDVNCGNAKCCGYNEK